MLATECMDHEAFQKWSNTSSPLIGTVSKKGAIS